MAMHFQHLEPIPDPEPPDTLAHEANDLAIRAQDAHHSVQALQAQIGSEMRHPVMERIKNASHSRGVILYIGLALAFLITTRWEWVTSREVYAVFLASSPWLPFMGCMAAALYASLCLGESTPQFALDLAPRLPNQELRGSGTTVDSLYSRKTVKQTRSTNWFLSPVTGVIVATLVCGFIFYASEKRVEWMQETGELTSDAGFQKYLPVGLYIVEIILGIPAIFVLVWLASFWRTRHTRVQITRGRDIELTLSHSAVARYSDYLTRFDDYNHSVRQRGRTPRPVIPPNRELMRLLTGGSEPLTEDAANPSTSHNEPEPARAQAGQEASQPSAQATAQAQARTPDDQRTNDLLGLVDDLIDRGNRTAQEK